jgi:hypothetical protein
MKCGYEVTRITLLQAYLYRLLQGVIFKVLPLSCYACSQMMLAPLGTLLWNSFQCHYHILLDVFGILKSSSL